MLWPWHRSEKAINDDIRKWCTWSKRDAALIYRNTMTKEVTKDSSHRIGLWSFIQAFQKDKVVKYKLKVYTRSNIPLLPNHSRWWTITLNMCCNNLNACSLVHLHSSVFHLKYDWTNPFENLDRFFSAVPLDFDAQYENKWIWLELKWGRIIWNSILETTNSSLQCQEVEEYTYIKSWKHPEQSLRGKPADIHCTTSSNLIYILSITNRFPLRDKPALISIHYYVNASCTKTWP